MQIKAAEHGQRRADVVTDRPLVGCVLRMQSAARRSGAPALALVGFRLIRCRIYHAGVGAGWRRGAVLDNAVRCTVAAMYRFRPDPSPLHACSPAIGLAPAPACILLTGY